MKSCLFLIAFLASFLECKAQDSSYLPESYIGSMKVYTYYLKSYIPAELQVVMDSINRSPVQFYDIGESEIKDGVTVKPLREFRTINKYPDGWLLTYLHRYEKKHIHFVVFETKKGQRFKISSGTSEHDIDSFNTLRRRKIEKTIKFINLNSKKQKHKF